ncbi:GDP-mannose transporter, partial [Colletotrichum tanaceti]
GQLPKHYGYIRHKPHTTHNTHTHTEQSVLLLPGQTCPTTIPDNHYLFGERDRERERERVRVCVPTLYGSSVLVSPRLAPRPPATSITTMADRIKHDTDQGIPLRGSSFDGEEEGDSLVGRARAGPQRSSLLPPLSLSLADMDNNAPVSVLAYCMASISMTVVNKYVVSGASWNLTFFYLAAQAIICIAVITACKRVGMIKSLTPVTLDKSKKC